MPSYNSTSFRDDIEQIVDRHRLRGLTIESAVAVLEMVKLDLWLERTADTEDDNDFENNFFNDRN